MCVTLERLSDVLMCFIDLFELLMCNLLRILITVQCCLLVLNSYHFDVSHCRFVISILIRYQRTSRLLQVCTASQINKGIKENNNFYKNFKVFLLILECCLNILVLKLKYGIGTMSGLYLIDKCKSYMNLRIFVKSNCSLVVFVHVEQTCFLHLGGSDKILTQLRMYAMCQLYIALFFCEVISHFFIHLIIGLRKFMKVEVIDACDNVTKVKLGSVDILCSIHKSCVCKINFFYILFLLFSILFSTKQLINLFSSLDIYFLVFIFLRIFLCKVLVSYVLS